MNAESLKKELEDYFRIKVCIEEKETRKEIFLDLFNNKEGFHIITDLFTNNILIVKGEPQEKGANFLRTINNSNSTKRTAFLSLLSKQKEKYTILINNREIDIDSFVDNNEIWDNFEIIYIGIPFDTKNTKEYVEIVETFIGLFLSLIDYSIEGFEEGDSIVEKTTRYERNPINRKICLNHKGCKCCVCGFDFEKVYGDLGKNIIEIHHIKPVSELDKNYRIDPINDLVPVCSNCHTMLHKKNPPLLPEELKEIMRDVKSQDQN